MYKKIPTKEANLRVVRANLSLRYVKRDNRDLQIWKEAYKGVYLAPLIRYFPYD